jgi:iron complex outermembrane recepter protein
MLSHLSSSLLHRLLPLWLLWNFSSAAHALAGRSYPDLTVLSLEDLLQVEIITASKKEQPILETSAAVFVLTAEAIRRSGAGSLPDALRLVPGVQVARIDANKWAISIRGFNAQFANKLLVLIDGRTVYTPTFSGVFWDLQDLLLEDVERIEVIRGPGAALWGTNAVNGIINIITAHSRDSRGNLVSLTSGTEERGQLSLRHGGCLENGINYRIYARYLDRDSAIDASGADAADAWQLGRVGFRLDWTVLPTDDLTVQGNIYDGETGQTYPLISASLSPPYKRPFSTRTDIAGGYLLTRWKHRSSPSSEIALQLYYDRNERSDPMYGPEIRDSFDADLQHRFAYGSRHEIVWGAAIRQTADENENSFFATLEPASRTERQVSAFAHDDITFLDEKLRLTLGSKLEWNTDVGLTLQPNGRLLWKARPQQALWVALSRALRTPSRFDDDGRIVIDIFPPDSLFSGTPVTLATLLGNRDLKPEELLALELGYRVRPIPSLFVEAMTFYNIYDDLNSLELSTPESIDRPVPHLILPLTLGNRLHGSTRGLELTANWQPRPWCRLRTSYSYLHLQFELDSGSRDPDLTVPQLLANPRHQLFHHASLNLPGRLELDLVTRRVSHLPELDIPGYTGLDIRLGWRPESGPAFSLIGRDLLDAHHPEFTSELEELQRTQVQRSAYATASLEF